MSTWSVELSHSASGSIAHNYGLTWNEAQKQAKQYREWPERSELYQVTVTKIEDTNVMLDWANSVSAQLTEPSEDLTYLINLLTEWT